MAKKNSWISMELQVGIFIVAGLILCAIAIITLGSADNLFTRSNRYRTHFATIDGLIPGAKVAIGGFQVGSVTDVVFDGEKRDLIVTYKVGRKYSEWIRKDTVAEIVTQGMLGDKFVSLTVGSPDQEMVADGGELTSRTSKGLMEILGKSDELMTRITSAAGNLDKILRSFEGNGRSEVFFQGLTVTAKNLGALTTQLEAAKLGDTAKQLNSVIAKVNNGTGTLGALINDPGLYYDVRAMMGGANRNKVIRNLVRQTVKDGEKRAIQESAQEDKASSAP